MVEIFSEYGIIFALFPIAIAFGWCLHIVALPFSLIKQKRFPNIWDTLPFAKRCRRGKEKAVATIIFVLFLLFISMDYSLVAFFDAILLGKEHWFVSAGTIILTYNWIGCLIYDNAEDYNGSSK